MGSCDELCRPTARCFKGLSILFALWGGAALLISIMSPTIIIIHLKTDTYDDTPTKDLEPTFVEVAEAYAAQDSHWLEPPEAFS